MSLCYFTETSLVARLLIINRQLRLAPKQKVIKTYQLVSQLLILSESQL